MSQIAVRLSESDLTGLDAAVAEGSYSSRADAVRAGIKLLERELREARIARSYRVAYTNVPPTDEETRMLDAAAARVGAALAADAHA